MARRLTPIVYYKPVLENALSAFCDQDLDFDYGPQGALLQRLGLSSGHLDRSYHQSAWWNLLESSAVQHL